VVFSGAERAGQVALRRMIREIVRIARIDFLGYLERFDFRRQTPAEIVDKAAKTLRMNAILKFFKK
jgi:hypothetical protein